MVFHLESALFNRVAHQDENFAPRKTGWVMTLLAVVTMVALTVHEGLSVHYDGKMDTRLEIHQPKDSYFNIHVNVSFPHVSCDSLQVITTTHQSVFMIPSPTVNTDIKRIIRNDICFLEGFVKVPRANGLLWIQSSKESEHPPNIMPNYTHTVHNFDFHHEDFNKQVTLSVSRWSLMSVFGLTGLDAKGMYGLGQHNKLAFSINGWTFTFPEWTTPPPDVDTSKPVDRYFYEINVSPQAVERNGAQLKWMSYRQTFFPHHSRYYLTEEDGGWGWLSKGENIYGGVDQDFNHVAQASSTSVTFSYQLLDLATVKRPKKTNLSFHVSRILASLGGVYVLFAVADRILLLLPVLCGAKLD